MAIAIDDLTGGQVAGNGAFDELMRATKSHLLEEFSTGRITGAMYTEAYTAAISMNLQVATQYALALPKVNQELLLLQEQTLKVAQDTLLVQEQVKSTIISAALADQNRLLAVETTKEAVQRVLIAEAELVRMAKDLEVLDAGLLQASKELLKTVAETALVTQQTANAVSTNATIVKQNTKLDSDTAFIVQKTRTEAAQIVDSVDGAPVGGVIGKQKDLYEAQKEGFFRDAEQKTLKLVMDTWTVRQTTDGALTAPAGIDDASIKQVVDKAKEGIGIV